jgi:hypothetical protein
MVFFALTRSGYDDIKGCLSQQGAILWVNGGVLTASEIQALRDSGLEVSIFRERIDLNEAALDDAVSLVIDHHPDTTIWLETHTPR